MTSALITLPRSIIAGNVIEIRLLVGHPMETGHRPNSQGQVVPRNIIRHLYCRMNNELVFSADFFPAIAANPFVTFPLKVDRSGVLEATWQGDQGFSHTERINISL